MFVLTGSVMEEMISNGFRQPSQIVLSVCGSCVRNSFNTGKLILLECCRIVINNID